MNRRAFLGSLGLLPVVARSYFDMGAAWQKHDSGLWVKIVTDDYVYVHLEAAPGYSLGRDWIVTDAYRVRDSGTLRFTVEY